MKNLTTNNTTSNATNYIQKAFTTLTAKGNEVVITITKRIVNVTSEAFESRYEYGVTYNNNEVAESLDRESLNYYLNFVDKYAGTRFL